MIIIWGISVHALWKHHLSMSHRIDAFATGRRPPRGRRTPRRGARARRRRRCAAPRTWRESSRPARRVWVYLSMYLHVQCFYRPDTQSTYRLDPESGRERRAGEEQMLTKCCENLTKCCQNLTKVCQMLSLFCQNVDKNTKCRQNIVKNSSTM